MPLESFGQGVLGIWALGVQLTSGAVVQVLIGHLPVDSEVPCPTGRGTGKQSPGPSPTNWACNRVPFAPV